jgi:hypothetical protein
MPTITIELTDAEYKALAYVAVDPVEWVTNFTKVRCAAAAQEVYVSEIARLNADPNVESIPADPAEVLRNAPLVSAAERQAEFLANPPIVPAPPLDVVQNK